MLLLWDCQHISNLLFWNSKEGLMHWGPIQGSTRLLCLIFLCSLFLLSQIDSPKCKKHEVFLHKYWNYVYEPVGS